MKKQYLVLAVGVLLVAIFAVAAFLYDKQKTDEIYQQAQQNAAYLIRDYSPTTGNPSAKVTIVEFFDPACETCKAFHPFIKNLMKLNPGKIKLIMRYTPFHPDSDYVVKILEASRLQGKFWETLDATYEAQPVWSTHGNPQPEKLWTRLDSVGLDLEQTRKDMEKPFILQRMRQDMMDAKQLQVTKTPGFFVNGRPLIKFGYKQLQDLVESEISRERLSD